MNRSRNLFNFTILTNRLDVKGLKSAKNKVILLVSVILVECLILSTAISALMKTIPSKGRIEYAGSSSPLHVEGRYIKDDSENVIYLRGVQIGPDFCDSATASWIFLEGWDPDRASQHLDVVKSWGGNCIRMHVAIQCWKEDLIGVTGVSHRQAVKELLDLLAERNMYLIYDFYSIRPAPYAFPATAPWGDPYDTSWLPWPPWQLGGSGATDPFYEEIVGSQQEFVDICASVASELKDYPNFIFELWNEPHPPDAMSEWYPVAQNCISAIRNEGADWMVIFQWRYGVDPSAPISDWVYDCVFEEDLNVLISTHIYPYYGGLGGARTYEAIEAALQTMGVTEWTQGGTTRNPTGHPLFVGETGCASGEEDIWGNLLQHYHDKDIHYTAFWFRPEGVFRLISDVNFSPTSAGEILMDALGQEEEVSEPRMLHTEGAHLVNDLGKRVHLHGVCKNDFIEDSWGLMVNEAGVINNLDEMVSWRCNFLALGVEVMWYLEDRYGVRTNINRVVQLAYDRGIYVGIGVFGWDNYGGPSGPWAGNAAGEQVINNPETYINFWLNVSNDFRDSANVLYGSLAEVAWGLDPINHGQPTDPPQEEMMWSYFNVICDAVRAIRNSGDEHIFMYHEDYCGYPSRFNRPATEGGEMIRKLHEQPLDPANPTGPKLTNIVYDAHVYRYHSTFGGSPGVFDMSTATGMNDDGVYERPGIMDALTFWGYFKILNEYQVPIIMWEGGASSDLTAPNTREKELTCWDNVLRIFHELDISYAAFWWRPAWPWALINTDLSPNDWGQVLIDTISALAG